VGAERVTPSGTVVELTYTFPLPSVDVTVMVTVTPAAATAVWLPVRVSVDAPFTMELNAPVIPAGKPLTLSVLVAGTSPPTLVNVTASVAVPAESMTICVLPSLSNSPGA